MKKIGIFSFVYFLLSALTFYVVADEGGAAGDAAAAQNAQEGGTNDKTEDIGNTSIGDEGTASLTTEEIKELRAANAQHQETQMINAVEKSIKTRIPEFSAEKTIAGLRELANTDPKKAEYYNSSEAGWEMYHRDVTAKIAQSDAVNSGSHAGNGGDFGSALEKARSGDKKSVKDVLAQSKA